MPLKLNVGWSKKIGMPNYGSLGATCHVEVELDQGLLFHDVDALREKVAEAFFACRQAVQAELQRHQGGRAGADREADEIQEETQPQEQGLAADNGEGSEPNGGPTVNRPRSCLRMVTPNQVRALEAIARSRSIELADVLFDRFGTTDLSDLSLSEASDLIDELQS